MNRTRLLIAWSILAVIALAADITVDTCALESHFERSVVLTGQDRQFYRAVEAMCRAKFSQDDAAYTAARATALSYLPK